MIMHSRINILPLRNRFVHCVFVGAIVLLSGNAFGQNDRLYDVEGNNIAGTITATNPKGVQLKKGGSTQSVISSNVKKILFDGDPSSLVKGREFAVDNQYDQALSELQNVDASKIKRALVKADLQFYMALSQAKLALSGKGAKDAAVVSMLNFIKQNRDSWHFFDAAKVLGDLALGLGKPDEATKYYKLLGGAVSADRKVESVYLQGMVLLKSGKSSEALEQFEKVIALPSRTAGTARIQILARAGKSVALAQKGQTDESLKLVNSLIEELNPADSEMASRIYNAQGASFEALNDAEGAILAYLHTHLMFSTQADAHAEALLRLAKLWPQVGKPDRAAEARQELQQRYPDAK